MPGAGVGHRATHLRRGVRKRRKSDIEEPPHSTDPALTRYASSPYRPTQSLRMSGPDTRAA
eukprot:885811-Rhodomonas_salina.1